MRNRNSGTRVVPGEAGAKAQGAAGRAGHCPAPGRGAGVHRGPRPPGSHYSVRGKGGFCFCCREPVAPSSPASRGERLEFRVLLRQLGVADGRVIQVAESQPYQMRTAPASAQGGVMKRVWSNVTARAQCTRALSPHRASRARCCFADVPLHHPPAPREAGRSCRPHFTDTELRHIKVTSGMPRATQGLQLGPDPDRVARGPTLSTGPPASEGPATQGRLQGGHRGEAVRGTWATHGHVPTQTGRASREDCRGRLDSGLHLWRREPRGFPAGRPKEAMPSLLSWRRPSALGTTTGRRRTTRLASRGGLAAKRTEARGRGRQAPRALQGGPGPGRASAWGQGGPAGDREGCSEETGCRQDPRSRSPRRWGRRGRGAGGPARNRGAGTRPEAGRLGGSELGPLGGRRSQLVLQPEAH